MEQVKNLDDKRVCDKSKDGKVIVIRKKDCITDILWNFTIITKMLRSPLVLNIGGILFAV